MRRLVNLALGLIIAWSVAVAALLLFRHQLIYPFRDWPVATQVSGLPGARAETVLAPDGTQITVWRVAARPGYATIIYFMGNAGSLPSAAPRLAELAAAGYGIVAVNYRGAGGAPGHPREDVLIADALAVYDTVSGPDGGSPPVVYGTSLGAAVAVQLAARRPVGALILETPFAELCETAEHHYPFVPACWLLWDERWESVAAIRDHLGPLLVLHGDADQVIPVDHGRRLFAAANEPKTLIVYPGGRHNDLRLHGAGLDVIRFLEGLGGG